MQSKDKLNICMLSTMYLRYKTDTRGLMVYETVKNLIKQNINIEIVAPNDYGYKDEEIIEGIKINRFNYFWPKKFQRLAYGSGIPTNLRKSFLAKLQVPFFAISFLLKSIKVAKKCDIIHAQWIASGLIGVLTKIFTGKKVIVTVRRVSNKGIMKFVNKFVLKNADYVIFNSSYTLRESINIINPKKYSAIWNSIDTKKFSPANASYLRKKLKLENKKIIFSLGLLVEKKGFEYLIRSMGQIVKHDKNVVLIIGGDGSDKERLTHLVDKLHLQDNVKFMGTIDSDKTKDFYNLADIFVLPSIIDSKEETETLGVVLLEAMACEKPVIGSKVGGIPDIIDKNVGFLVKQKDVFSLSEKIIYLLKNKALCKRLGKEGRKKVINSFSEELLTKKTIDVYNSLIR